MEDDYQTNRFEPLKDLKSILIIRFYALGDLTITFPYIADIKRQLPDLQIDIVTTNDYSDYCKSIDLFDDVIQLKHSRSTRKLVVSAIKNIPKLISKKYDIIIDLQNNWVSRFIRKSINAKHYSQFDRFSPIPAGERTANTIKSLGFDNINPFFNLKSNLHSEVKEKLIHAGWNTENQLVILNPAGFFESRNWPIENYISFAELWKKKFPNTQFLLLGIDRMAQKSMQLELALKDHTINLVRKTSISEAFALVQYASFVLSEDSGLMHMAWVSGKPTVALFGSSRSDWSRPLGNHSLCLNSSDLECGECMKAICKFGDVRCLTRFSPEYVLERSVELLDSIKK